MTRAPNGDPDTIVPAPSPRKQPPHARPDKPSDGAVALDGCALIAAERQRQVQVEGWTPAHDDAHKDGSLARAAACYAAQASAFTRVMYDVPLSVYQASDPPQNIGWPWSAKWWKPKDRVRDLVRAGALIAAEIDRLTRAAEREKEL